MKALIWLFAAVTAALEGGFANSAQKTMSPINLLLPASSETHVEFVVNAYNGCYKFSSSDPGIISISHLQVEGEQGECGTQAIARVEVSSPSRSVVWLIAEDVNTGIVLRCQARVGELSRIEIMTRMRQVDVGVYETVEIVGYDIEGNAFNSLEGLKFGWSLTQSGDLAELSSFKEAQLEVSRTRLRIESAQEFSDQIVLKTKKVGKVVLEAKLKDRRFGPVVNAVTLRIAEHIIFRPENEINMLRNSAVQLTAYVLKGDRNNRKIERLDSLGRFSMRTVNRAIAEVDSAGRVSSKSVLGETDLEITDTKNEDTVFRIKVNVMDAESITGTLYQTTAEGGRELMEMSEGYPFGPVRKLEDMTKIDDWTTVAGRIYAVKLTVRGKGGAEINTSQETIEFSGFNKAFDTIDSRNGIIVFRPRRPGTFAVAGSLASTPGHSQLLWTQSLTVYQPLLILQPRNAKNEVFLPTISQTSEPQLLSLTTVGGSGNAICTSSNPNIAKIVPSNIVIVQSVGSTNIVCRDRDNAKNSDEFILKVEVLSEIEMPSRGETTPNVPIYIPWIVTDQHHRFYANCSLLVPNWTAKSLKGSTIDAHLSIEKVDSFSEFVKQLSKLSEFRVNSGSLAGELTLTRPDEFELYKEGDGSLDPKIKAYLDRVKGAGVCGFGKLVSTKPDMVQLTLASAGLAPKECIVKVHEPLELRIVQNYNKEVFGNVPIITPGTSVHFLATGGPQSWSDSQIELIKASTDDINGKSETTVKRTSEGFIIEVRCKEVSNQKGAEFTLHVSSQNQVDKQLLIPTLSTVNAYVKCGWPTQAKHILLSDSGAREWGFLNRFKNVLNLRNDKKHYFTLWAFDEQNFPFWNFTTSKVKPSLSDNSIGATFKAISPPSEKPAFEELPAHGSPVLELGLPKQTGKVISNVLVKTQSKVHPEMNSEVTIRSTQKLDIDPNAIEILLLENNQVWLTVLNGSGNFKVFVENELICTATALPDSRKIRVIPQRSGKTRVKVLDVGIESDTEAYADIEVVEVDSLKLVLSDRSIENKSETKLTLLASPAIQEQLSHLSVGLTASPDKGLEITRASPSAFNIKGIENGEFVIQAKIGERALPQRVILRVHQPFSLFPDKLVLMPGCQTYFRIVGGPHDLFTPEYEVKSSKVGNLGTLTELSPGFYRFEANKGKGKGQIDFSVISGGKELSAAKVIILIDFPTELVISGPFKLLQHASAIIWAAPRYYQDEFSPGFCRMNFSYRLGSESKFLSVNSLTLEQTQNASFLSLFVTALKVGVERIEFELETDPSLKGIKIKKAFPVRVVENHDLSNLLLLGKDSECKSVFGDGSFTIPPRATLAFPPRLHTIITPINNVVERGDRNSIVSLDRIGKDSLTLTDTDSDVQASKHVQVVIPSHLVVEGVQKIAFLQNRRSVTLKAHFMDAVGRLFTPTSSPLLLEVINTDQNIVQVDYDENSASLKVTSKQDGRVIIFVKSVEFPRLVCPILIVVGTMIHPVGPLTIHIGSEVDFESAFDKTVGLRTGDLGQKKEGTWTSSDPIIMEIDAKTGRAIARSTGKATITWNGPLVSEVPVTVTEVEGLRPAVTTLTVSDLKDNPYYQPKYQFEYELLLKGTERNLTISKEIKDYLDFSCKSNSNSVVARASQNRVPATSTAPEVRQFICTVEMVPSSYLASDVKITAQLSSKSANFTVSSVDRLNAISSFIINQRDFKVSLSRNEPHKSIYIKTSSRLRVTPSAALVGLVTTEFRDQEKVQMVKIEFPNGVNEDVHGIIEVTNPETRQIETINVNYERTMSILSFLNIFPKGDQKSNKFSDLMLIVICITVLYVVFKTLLKRNDTDRSWALSHINSRATKSKLD